jgi:hypothetical protein
MESASAVSSVQLPDVLPRKRSPAKGPPFLLDDKTRDHVLPNFQHPGVTVVRQDVKCV